MSSLQISNEKQSCCDMVVTGYPISGVPATSNLFSFFLEEYYELVNFLVTLQDDPFVDDVYVHSITQYNSYNMDFFSVHLLLNHKFYLPLQTLLQYGGPRKKWTDNELNTWPSSSKTDLHTTTRLVNMCEPLKHLQKWFTSKSLKVKAEQLPETLAHLKEQWYIQTIWSILSISFFQ